MADTSASVYHLIATSRLPVRRIFASGLPLSIAGLRQTLETWEERKRLRLKLEDMLATAPHLIDDIGMTKIQAEEEIAKPFWRD
ncbi:MAG: DUF1127 domain-containing protein [Rhizobiaceae bacterium]